MESSEAEDSAGVELIIDKSESENRVGGVDSKTSDSGELGGGKSLLLGAGTGVGDAGWVGGGWAGEFISGCCCVPVSKASNLPSISCSEERNWMYQSGTGSGSITAAGSRS